MTATAEGIERRPADAAEAVLLVGFCFAALKTFGGLLQSSFGLGGVALSELLLVLLPSLVWLRITRLAPVTALGLARPSGRSLGFAAVAAVGGFYLVAGGLEPLQEYFVPLPAALREQLQRLIVPGSGRRPLALDLAALAIAPAACEEILFRGVLLRALLSSDRRLALLVSSLAFGAFHFSTWKLVPTATLGLLLGVITLRAASVWPAILAHAINNTLVIVLVRAGYEAPPGLAGEAATVPRIGIGLLLAAAATVASVWAVAPKRPKRPQ